MNSNDIHLWKSFFHKQIIKLFQKSSSLWVEKQEKKRENSMLKKNWNFISSEVWNLMTRQMLQQKMLKNNCFWLIVTLFKLNYLEIRVWFGCYHCHHFSHTHRLWKWDHKNNKIDSFQLFLLLCFLEKNK